MSDAFIAEAETTINAPVADVWDALVNPARIREYMFGTTVKSDWNAGSAITWMGEYEGKPYQDKGTILEIIPERALAVTHYSPLSGAEDRPENYHTLRYELRDAGGATHISLTQDNNANRDEQEHAAGMWRVMLEELRKHLENQG
jgi:uncharacterized protein YndB with AHSA1/START domain